MGDVGEDLGLSLDFLGVDTFIMMFVDARALKTAFETGLVDRLIANRSGSAEALGRANAPAPFRR
jgi:hypothetical protein